MQAQQVRDYLFGVTNGERVSRLLLAACVGLSFPNIWDKGIGLLNFVSGVLSFFYSYFFYKM